MKLNYELKELWITETLDELVAYLDQEHAHYVDDLRDALKGFEAERHAKTKEAMKNDRKAYKKAAASSGDPKAKRAPSDFNNFVREKSAYFKDNCPHIAAKDRMKEAAKLWKELKKDEAPGSSSKPAAVPAIVSDSEGEAPAAAPPAKKKEGKGKAAAAGK